MLLLQAAAATAAAAEALAAQKAAYAQQAAQLEAQRRALQAQEQAARQAEAERAQACPGSWAFHLFIIDMGTLQAQDVFACSESSRSSVSYVSALLHFLQLFLSVEPI